MKRKFYPIAVLNFTITIIVFLFQFPDSKLENSLKFFGTKLSHHDYFI
jgi:hypothetical protein